MIAAAPTSVDEIWKAFKANGRIELRNQLVERYLQFVKYHAERIHAKLPEGVELDDLISAGVFGLIDAIRAFDLSRGIKFETYCVPRIRGAIVDGLRDWDWVPRLIRMRASKLNAATTVLDCELGRPPTVIEIAERLRLSVAEVEAWQRETHIRRVGSLDRKVMESDDALREFRAKDEVHDPKGEDPTQRLREIDGIREITKGMNRAERLIVILYYYEEQTMKEIGATLDLSESRVSRMHTQLMTRLRRQMGIAVAPSRQATIERKPRSSRLQPIVTHEESNDRSVHPPARTASRVQPPSRGAAKGSGRNRQGTHRSHR